MSEWQDISTAPKDGRTIVAYRDEKGHKGLCLIFWCDHDGWCGLSADDEKRMVKYQPTHWASLPAHPEASQ